MTLTDARKILGLAPDEDPRPHLADFKNAREHIATMVRTAPNETLSARYQKGLIEFDHALAAIQQNLEATGLEPPPLPARTAEEAPIEPHTATDLSETAADEIKVTEKPTRRTISYIAWLLIFLAGAGGGAWIYVHTEQIKEGQRQTRIDFLQRQGSIMIENRRWPDAASAFAEMEALSPGSDLAMRGRRSIEAGMTEEQNQFIGYWTGQATAELEAGRLDEANTAARQVLDKFPGEKDATAILEQVSAARINQSRTASIAAARQALEQRKWNAAISTAKRILATAPNDPDARSILADATTAVEKSTADQAKAAELLKMAIARDQGQFDQQALDWLREAASLAPEDAEITTRLEKLASYTRTIHVPGDFATPAEALASAHDRDRIVLGTATWKGPLVINAAVELQGAGYAITRVECAPDDGSAITIGPDATGARVSGISFRHESFAVGTDRFAVALVRGGSATFVDCRFTEASGHGLAVIEGGQASISRSRFADNGWDGVAAIGHGSKLEVRDCESLNNFEHGIESWDGASVVLVNNRCEANDRNGIHADTGLASATIEGNQLIANREFGIVIDGAGSGKVTGNTARANLLGGMVIRAAAANVTVTSNEFTLNQGPGLVLEKGLSATAFSANSVNKNNGQQVLSDTDLTTDGDQLPETGKAPRDPAAAEPAAIKPQ